MNSKLITACAAPLLLAGWLVTGTAQAAEASPPGSGWGMMGGGYDGHGPGMMGPGYGPGMRWDDDDARGPWGGARGYGMGPGMMGGYGMGSGMMEPWWALDLNDKQRAAIDDLMAAQHKAHWPLMSRMFEAQGKLDELYRAEKWDSDAIGKAYDGLYKVQREMVEAHVRTRNRIMEQLTPEQKEQLNRYRWENRWRR